MPPVGHGDYGRLEATTSQTLLGAAHVIVRLARTLRARRDGILAPIRLGVSNGRTGIAIDLPPMKVHQRTGWRAEKRAVPEERVPLDKGV